ncbi:MAG: class I SAM-dependent methyltransferase [Dehalococcoidia bacterium]|jgi:SAM-dependent methyltransferase|nr:class I SAM-dependent methyltransferase [Dehalococcoidia bacterium]
MTRTALHNDYDEDPDRFLGGARLVERHWLTGDVHEIVAERFDEESAAHVLDIGCGNGRLIRQLSKHNINFIGIDQSPKMLADVDGPVLVGDATDLQFPDAHFDGAAALYMLYHLPDPKLAIAEAWRILQDGGLFVASAPSRYDDPELVPYLPESDPSTFDAEIGPGLINEIFHNVEVERWDLLGVYLPDTGAIAKYLYHHNAIPIERASRLALGVPAPLTLTKRGALIWARKNPT